MDWKSFMSIGKQKIELKGELDSRMASQRPGGFLAIHLPFLCLYIIILVVVFEQVSAVL
jgi:hypothetical protein